MFFLFRAEYECFQIELAKNYGVPEWREDLKKVLLKSGVENKSMVFLFSDTQVSMHGKILSENEPEIREDDLKKSRYQNLQ